MQKHTKATLAKRHTTTKQNEKKRKCCNEMIAQTNAPVSLNRSKLNAVGNAVDADACMRSLDELRLHVS
jgi:hypothetical protein